MRRLPVLLALVLVTGCGGEASTATRAPDAAPVKDAGHVHGLGATASGDVFIATHSGLFRAAAGERDARRVGDSHQDTMGFTITAHGRFLGSGHPDARTDDPPMLGLIASDDEGRTWQPVSLRGRADFHVLRTAGTRLYGMDSQSGLVLVSDDGGRSWAQRTPPAAVVDLAADPADPDQVVVATERGLALSRDTGRTWRPVDGPVGLLAWPRAGRLVAVSGDGRVWRTTRPGGGWRAVGDIGGQPAALAPAPTGLLAASHDGVVKVSSDDGATWQTRTSVRTAGA